MNKEKEIGKINAAVEMLSCQLENISDIMDWLADYKRLLEKEDADEQGQEE